MSQNQMRVAVDGLAASGPRGSQASVVFVRAAENQLKIQTEVKDFETGIPISIPAEQFLLAVKSLFPEITAVVAANLPSDAPQTLTEATVETRSGA